MTPKVIRKSCQNLVVKKSFFFLSKHIFSIFILFTSLLSPLKNKIKTSGFLTKINQRSCLYLCVYSNF